MIDEMNSLITALDLLIEIPNVGEEEKNKETCIELFRKIYKDNFRHSYSVLSSYLEVLDGEQRDLLVSELEDILLKVSDKNIEDETDWEKIHDGIFKLQDHISLECLRLTRMDTIKYYENETKSNLDETRKKIENSRREMRKISRQVSSVNAQVISILGIFAGLVFGFSAGFQLMGESFTALESIPYNVVLIYILCIGLVVFNLCFLLMYCTAKMSNQSIATTCKTIDCSECKSACCFFKRAWKKYAYVLCFNAVDIALLLLLIILTATNVIQSEIPRPGR